MRTLAQRRSLTSLLWLAMVLIGCSACFNAANAQEASPTGTPPKPAAPAPREVRLGYFANVTHAQAVLGVDSGQFAAAVAPAKLTTRTFNAGPSLIEALFAGEIDIGYVGPSPALAAHLQSRGRGIRIIAGAASGGVVIIARPGAGIEKLADLKGKKIATPQMGNTQDVSARHYLIKELGQANADNVIPVPNAEQASMMSRGQIDAAWAVEPWGARLVAEAGGKIIAEEKDLWPDKAFTLTLVVSTPEFLDQHPDIIERLLSAHCEWTRRLSADGAGQTPALASALEKLTGKKLSEDLITAAISRVSFTDEPLTESLKAFARWAFELNLAKAVPNVNTLVDTRILAKVKAAGQQHPPTAPAELPKPSQAP